MSDQDPHADTRAAPRSEADTFAGFYEEHERLRGVATSELSNGAHGSFLKHFLEAYSHADFQNGRLLLPAMQALEKKYKLTDRFAKLQEHPTVDKSPGDDGSP